MKLAIHLSYSGSKLPSTWIASSKPSAWATTRSGRAEAYGSDAVVRRVDRARTSRIHVGTAHHADRGRTPAMTAMTAMTLDALSGGRFRLGLGCPGRRSSRAGTASRSASRSRRRASTSTWCARVLRREKPVEYHGDYYQIPYAGPMRPGSASR
jgi:hypothetical protein